MSINPDTTTVRRSVVVEASIERAFNLFTRDIGAWWDSDKHLLGEPLAEMIFEPHVGGHIIDRGTNGAENRWAPLWSTSRPTVWPSAGTSTSAGRSRPTRPEPVRYTSPSLPRTPSTPSWSWSTATSTVTATAGKRCVTPWAPPVVGISSPTQTPSPKPPDCRGRPLEGNVAAASIPELPGVSRGSE